MSEWVFVGGGNMAAAILGGFCSRYPGRKVHVADPSEACRVRLKSLGCDVTPSVSEVGPVQRCVLAVKPQVFPSAAEEIRSALAEDAVVVSIMVGISSETIAAALGTDRIVRVMPNTPMMVGKGVSGVAPCGTATKADVADVRELFGASGEVVEIVEEQIDRIAAVSGSGPAYFFRFCEAFIDAAVNTVGFKEEQARSLVASTAIGSLAYALSQENFPVERLRREVTSPGGTTEAAIRVFDQARLTGVFNDALEGALMRAEELRKGDER